MKKIMILSILLILVIFMSGCISKNAPQQPAQEKVPAAPAENVNLNSNDIPTPAESGINIETQDFNADTDVDLGSLI